MKFKIGQVVEFESDIEQCGEIIKIHGVCKEWLTLKNKHGFKGEYIGGDTETTIHVSDVIEICE